MSRAFLIVLAVVGVIALPAVIAWRVVAFLNSPTIERELSDKWIVELGRNGGRYVSRRTSDGWRMVSGKIFDARSLGDDCVMYSDYQYHLYGVCGDRNQVFIASFPSDARPAIGMRMTIGERDYLSEDVKRAAQETETTRVTGGWWIQPKAFPDGDVPEYLAYRDDGYGGTYLRTGSPWLSYRSLDDDCMLFTVQSAGGQASVGAECGRRDQLWLDRVAHPSEIETANELGLGGELTPLAEIKRRALAQPGR